MSIKQGSMKEVINSVYEILANDEELLRLLYYLPKIKSKERKEPLDSSLPNIKDMNNYDEIVMERIIFGEKVSDIVEKAICRIYITSGRRRSIYNNYLLATQEIIIRVYVHEDYLDDLRLEQISDRIIELLTLKRLDGGIGLFDYIAGDPFPAPQKYQAYTHKFEYGASKR